MSREIFSKASTEEKRRKLKRNQTQSEKILWEKLRARRLLDLKFRRQYGIGEYIVDFYCPKLRLVIEIDGSQHHTDEGREYDSLREEYMESLGLRTIRFRNREIEEDIEGVVEKIKDTVFSLYEQKGR